MIHLFSLPFFREGEGGFTSTYFSASGSHLDRILGEDTSIYVAPNACFRFWICCFVFEEYLLLSDDLVSVDDLC